MESALPLRHSFADSKIKEYRLTVEPTTVNLTGNGYPDTAVWSFARTVPGPELRMRQGDPVRVVVSNTLGEDTTVHWHGIRLPNAMDGVPGLTQPPIRPGESFTYDFRVSPARRHAATAWAWACRRIDHRGARAGSRRSRHFVVHRGLAARR